MNGIHQSVIEINDTVTAMKSNENRHKTKLFVKRRTVLITTQEYKSYFSSLRSLISIGYCSINSKTKLLENRANRTFNQCVSDHLFRPTEYSPYRTSILPTDVFKATHV